jgi:hypothetical protein
MLTVAVQRIENLFRLPEVGSSYRSTLNLREVVNPYQTMPEAAA